MAAELPRGGIVPPIGVLEVCSARRVQWINNAIAGLRGFAANQKQRISRGVVDETVAYPRPGGESREVSCNHVVKFAINPRINLAFDDVDELFLIRLRLRP